MLSEECPSNEGPDDAATHHPQTNQFKSKSHRESPDCANVTILCLNLAASGRCTTSKRRRTARNKTDFRRITDAPAARATVRGIGARPWVPSFFDNEPEGQYFPIRTFRRVRPLAVISSLPLEIACVWEDS